MKKKPAETVTKPARPRPSRVKDPFAAGLTLTPGNPRMDEMGHGLGKPGVVNFFSVCLESKWKTLHDQDVGNYVYIYGFPGSLIKAEVYASFQPDQIPGHRPPTEDQLFKLTLELTDAFSDLPSTFTVACKRHVIGASGANVVETLEISMTADSASDGRYTGLAPWKFGLIEFLILLNRRYHFRSVSFQRLKRKIPRLAL